MRERPYFKSKSYKFLPIRFLVERNLRKMTREIVDFLADFVKQREKVIDIGAGAGWVSQELKVRKGTENILLDVINLNQTELPLVIYNGKNIPFGDNTFNSAILICVLHHCQDPLQVLEEAKRIVKDRIIIIENISTSFLGGIALRIKDTVANVAFCLMANSLREITNLPFYFKTTSEWEQIFENLNLKVIYKKESQPLLSHHSVAFVLEK